MYGSFDSVESGIVAAVLQALRRHPDDIEMAKEALKNVKFKVLVADGMSSARKQKQGSAQGASESTYIFAAELEPLIRLLEHMAAENGKNSEIGYACGETILSILAYADDMVMLASSEEGLAEMVRALERFRDRDIASGQV